MKKHLLLIVAVLALSAFAFAEFKVGIINPQAVLQGSVKGKEAIGRLQALQAGKQKKYEALQAEIDALEKEIGSPALNADAREKKSQDLVAKRTEIKRFAEDAQKDSLAAQQKEFEKIQGELMPLIEKIAKENGFAMVLDLTTSGVTFFEPALDLTEKVIKAYDAQAAAAPAAKK